MENNEYVQFQPTKEQEKINKIHLHRRERIGQTYGSGLMRTIVIIFTIFLSLDFFLSFMSFITSQYSVSVIVSSLYWMVIMVIRFLPNVVTCIALWIIFSKAHNHRKISVAGFRLMQIILIFQGVVSLISMIIGVIYIVCEPSVIAMEGLSESGTYILMIALLVIVQLVKILLYTFLSISVSGVFKDKKGLNKLPLGFGSSIVALVVGGLLLINMIPLYNILSESIYSLGLEYTDLYYLFETVLLNPLNMIFYGIFIGFGGLIGLLYCIKQKKINEAQNADI